MSRDENGAAPKLRAIEDERFVFATVIATTAVLEQRFRVILMQLHAAADGRDLVCVTSFSRNGIATPVAFVKAFMIAPRPACERR